MPDRLAVIELLRAAGVECYTRDQWGSPRERDGSYARRRTTHPMPSAPAAYHFLHITVTADTDTVAEGAAGARQVESYGLSTPPMVSYQDLVTNEGRYFQGQDYGTKGTHTINDKGVAGYANDLNLAGYATAIMQNVEDEVSDEQVRVVAMIFAARELAGWVRRGAPIHPHRTFAWKSCPGDKAVARLDEIRRLRDQFVRDGLTNQGDEIMADQADRIIEAGKANTDRILARIGGAEGRERGRDQGQQQRLLARLDVLSSEIGASEATDETVEQLRARVRRFKAALEAARAEAEAGA